MCGKFYNPTELYRFDGFYICSRCRQEYILLKLKLEKEIKRKELEKFGKLL
jgi:hypothetical protein